LRKVSRALGVKDWSTVPLAVKLLRIPVKREGRSMTIDAQGFKTLQAALENAGVIRPAHNRGLKAMLRETP
jgi:hypothetical protein